MKTKELIRNEARSLFNEFGVRNITLREIAKKLGKSYGNITYHYGTKSDLIVALYEDLIEDTRSIMNQIDVANPFMSILEAPKYTFEISIKHLFFYVDYIEIKRSYPLISEKLDADNAKRKIVFFEVLKTIQKEGYLRPDLSKDDLNYLMDLSGAMRTFFFINLNPTSKSLDINLRTEYLNYLNRLLFPYLSEKGVKIYRKHINQ